MPVADPVFIPLHRHSEHGVEEPKDDMMHAVCECNMDIALCGTDVSNVPLSPRGSRLDCVVCDDLEYGLCPRCGC